VVEGIVRVSDYPAAADPTWTGDAPNPATSYAPWRVFNIGNNQPVMLLDFISTLAESLGREAQIELLPMEPGDVVSTMADVSALERATGFRPSTTLRDGLSRFTQWYLAYYGV
jgi:UDP-glucuronate 4-epimerase